ncbi:MAG TPA: MMPL family transporter [Vicinamibacterales bacterium]
MIDVLVTWAYRRRALVIAAAFCILAVSAEGARQLSFETDVLTLLPRNGRVIPAFRSFLSTFGSLDQLYVVFTAPDGYPISDYGDRIDAWIDHLRAAPEIDRVDTGTADESRNIGWLADRQLLLLDAGMLDEALDRLRPKGLSAAVASRRELLTLPSSNVSDLVRHDPAGLFELTRKALGGGAPNGMEGGYVTPDGSSRLVIAYPKRPPYDAEFSRALDARLRSMTAQQNEASTNSDAADTRPALQVELAGGHRIAVETEAFIRRESIVNTFGSLALILPLLFFVFRSTWLVIVGPLPSALSLIVVLGIFGFTGATLSAAATGSAAMLFGLGVDGVVLLYVSHRLALARGLDTAAAIQAIAEPSKSMLLGMWTTAATFYGLMFVDFPSLQELGRLVGHSMVVCGLATLFLVPATLPRRSRPAQRALVLPRLATWIARHRTAIIGGSIAVTVLFGIAATRIRVNPTLERLRSVTDAAALEARIGSTFGLPGDVSVIVMHGRDLEHLLTTNETLIARLARDTPAVRVEAAARLLPSGATQTRRAQRIDASGITATGVRASLVEAAATAGFQRSAFDGFAERVPRLLDSRLRLTYEDYVSHGFRDLIGRFISHREGEWMLATYVFPRTPEELTAIQTVVDAVDPAQTLTGLPLVNRELSRRFLPQFLKGLAIGTIMVIASLVLVFRDWRLCALALLPTFAGLVWTAGVLALAGVELDLFAVFAVVTFVGIGVDYGIHMVHRYRERRDPAQAVAELAPVILAAAAITLFGYGTLITSSYPPLQSIGLVSAISVCALALASVILLPALMMRTRG